MQRVYSLKQMNKLMSSQIIAAIAIIAIIIIAIISIIALAV